MEPPRRLRDALAGSPHRTGGRNAVALAAGIIAVLGSWPGARAETPPPRDILLILTDDHRYDALGFQGHPFLETPHLDRLAASGAHFENAFVTTSLCSPSRASILTGRYAHNHDVVDNYHPVREDLHFFPQTLQANGYETAFVGKWHMGDTDEPQRGFDHWVSFRGQGVYWPHEEGLEVEGRYVPQAHRTGFNVNGKRVPQEGYITDELTDYALEWLGDREAQGGERPFFLYLSHKAVHADFLPPNRHAFRYEDEAFPKPKTWATHPDEFHGVPRWVKNQRNSRHGVEFAYYMDLDLANYYRRYCETILAVDESLGRVLDWLEANDRLESTLVLYLGDNGFLFGEHGLIDKRCAYEESIRIPMILHCPELVQAGTRVPEMVANIDVGPTLLEAAGAEVPAFMDGRSFLPLARGESIPWRDLLLYEYFWERNYPQTPTTHAVRGSRYKYIRYHGVWDTDELYDLQEDPRETTNLIHHPDHAERVADLNRRLFGLLRETGGTDLRLLEDRGTKFLHRKEGGTRSAPFPEWFYREPGTTGK